MGRRDKVFEAMKKGLLGLDLVVDVRGDVDVVQDRLLLLGLERG